MRIFIHHDGGLGDVILSLPCVLSIKQKGAVVHFAGREDIGRLLREAGIVDEQSSSGSARYASLYAGPAGGEARKFLSSFDRALVFTVQPGSPLVAAIGDVIPRTTAVATLPPAGVKSHAAAFRLSQLGRQAEAPQGPLLPVPGYAGDFAAGLLSKAGYDGRRPVLAVHPGSGGKAKCWPLEKYFDLLAELKTSTGLFLVILTGPAEDERVRDRVEAFSRGQEGILSVDGAELVAAAALLNRCGLYLGNDSGVSHLAAASGCRVLVLFGPTDPAVWRPAGPLVDVIAAEDMDAIDVNRVSRRITGILHSPHPFPLPHGERGQEKASCLHS